MHNQIYLPTANNMCVSFTKQIPVDHLQEAYAYALGALHRIMRIIAWLPTMISF